VIKKVKGEFIIMDFLFSSNFRVMVKNRAWFVVVSMYLSLIDFVREKKGRIWRLNDWGMRKLAYKIQKARKANYILMNIELKPQAINDFKALLDKDERVIRHLVITRDKAMTEKTEAPPEYSTLKDDEDYEDGDDEEVYEDDENEGDDEGGANEVRVESLVEA
jgi:ribosomal protein S6